MIAAICDDDPLFRKEVREFLIDYKTQRRIHLDILEFPNGQSLLNYDRSFDIVLLDYEMPKINGLTVAKELRRRKNICCIVFLTSYPEYAIEAYEVSTYRYLVKPLYEIKLKKCLDNYITERKMQAPIVINMDGEQYTVNSEDIIFLEGAGKFCNIYTVDNVFRSSKTLSAVYDMLPQHCFFRTHKSYVVNMYCISSIKDFCVMLNNGEKAKISRHKLTEFKMAYKNFIKNFITRM